MGKLLPDRPHERAWRAVLKGHALLTTRLDTDLRSSAGISLAEYDVLVQLDEAPARRLSMAGLARAVVYSRSGLTRLVDSLENQGLVMRERNENDRRSWFAIITDKGRATLKSAGRAHSAGVRDHFAAHASEAQARALADVYGAIIADLAPDDPELRHFHP